MSSATVHSLTCEDMGLLSALGRKGFYCLGKLFALSPEDWESRVQKQNQEVSPSIPAVAQGHAESNLCTRASGLPRRSPCGESRYQYV